MPEHLKHYKLKITALSPIHIGDGTVIGKKEYIRNRKEKKVIIPDNAKMFKDLIKLNRMPAFQEYMLNDGYNDLGNWLNSEKIPLNRINSWEKYSLEARDAFIESKSGKVKKGTDIISFIKDAYGKAYLPGSSLKGMIRTAIISMEIGKNPDKYRTVKRKLEDKVNNSVNIGRITKNFLNSETRIIENEALIKYTCDRYAQDNTEIKPLSGLIVSDSEPIEPVQLTLSQKIDYTVNGRENSLPIMRESLIPGTDTVFDITIDGNLCSLTIEDIMEALDFFQQNCYEYFYKKFGRGSNKAGTVWIGGGTGFLSKTIIYQIYGNIGLDVTDSIFGSTVKKYREHHHDNDAYLGVSPHVCKCTYYHGRLYDMGMGKIELLG